jgi:hypothetical protein
MPAFIAMQPEERAGQPASLHRQLAKLRVQAEPVRLPGS